MATIYMDRAFKRDRSVLALIRVTPEASSYLDLDGISQRQREAINAIMGKPDLFLDGTGPAYRDMVLAQEDLLLHLLRGIGLLTAPSIPIAEVTCPSAYADTPSATHADKDQ